MVSDHFSRGAAMRFSIRYQLLLPLLALLLGLVAASTWSAWAAGRQAREQIERQIDDIAKTVQPGRFPLNMVTLNLMKGMSGAEFLLCDDERRAIHSTLPDVPAALPSPGGDPTQHFDKPVLVGKNSYLCGGIRVEQGARPVLYIFYPESLWHEAAWQALRPALWVGVLGSMIAVALSLLLTQGLTGRIQELERR